MTKTSTTATASPSAAVPALSDERNDGGVVVHSSLVHALGSCRATTTVTTSVTAAKPPRPRPLATRDPPCRCRCCRRHRQPNDAPPPKEREFRGALPVPCSGQQRCPTDPDNDPPGPGALSPPPLRPPLPPWGDPNGPASGAAATTPPDIGINGSGGGGVHGCVSDCGGGSLIIRCMAGRGGGSEVLWCCSRKKGKKGKCVTQKAHTYCHQFERRVVWVYTINLLKGARLLHEILGHW